MSSWWPSAFWCIVGIGGGAIVSFIISWFFFVVGKECQLLEYQVSSTNLITKEMPGIPGMDITLNGRAIDNLTSSTIKFINSGNKTIYQEDFAKSSQLGIAAEGCIFISKDGFQIVSSNFSFQPSVSIENNKMYISFEFMKKGQSFSITMLHSGKL